MADLYPVNQPIRLSTTVRDVLGALVDPTALVLSYVNAAPGSVAVTKNWPAPAEITKDGTGLFHYDAAGIAVVGRYRITWTATGTNAGVDSDVFDVFDPATFPRLVSFADAKSFLRLQGTADDALLDRMVGWASARILVEVQAYPATKTEVVTVGSDGSFVLSHTPVTAVASMTRLSSLQPAPDVTKLVVSSPAGGVVEPMGTQAWGSYTVVYTAGYAEVPPGVDGACLQLLQHWWNQSQAHGSSTYGDAGFVPDFRDLPNSVRSKLAVVPILPGVG